MSAETLLRRLGAFDDCWYVALNRLDETAQKFRGSYPRIAPRLRALNGIGQDIWYAVNQFAPDAPAKKSEFVTHYRAHMADVDQIGAKPPDLPPTIVVESSPGKRQYLWIFEKPELYPEWSAVQAWWVTQVPGADLNVKDPARVLRLPGYTNNKYTGRPPVRLLEANGPLYTPAQFLALAPPIVPLPARAIQPETDATHFSQRLERESVPAPRSGKRNPWVYKLAAYGVRDLHMPPDQVAELIYDKMSSQGLDSYDYEKVRGIVANATQRTTALPQYRAIPSVRVL
jgi:hypothetical protein